MIPALISSKDLHEANAAFHKPPRDQASRAVVLRLFLIDAVKLMDRL